MFKYILICVGVIGLLVFLTVLILEKDNKKQFGIKNSLNKPKRYIVV